MGGAGGHTPQYKTRPALKCSQNSLPTFLCTGTRDTEDSGIVGWSSGQGHPTWEQVRPAHLFPEHCAGWTLPRSVTASATSAVSCAFLQCKLVGLEQKGVAECHLAHMKWGKDTGPSVCCYPFLSPLCRQWGTCFVPGTLWACLSPPCACPAPHVLVLWPPHPSPCCRVFKNTEELRTRITSGIIAPLGAPAEKAKNEPESKEDVHWDENPLRIPPRQPVGTRAPYR